MKTNGNGKNGKGGGNRVKHVMDEAHEPEVSSVATADEAETSETSGGNDEAAALAEAATTETEVTPKKKAEEKAKKLIEKARAPLHEKLRDLVLPNFTHGTEAIYPNAGSRSIIMKDDKKNDGRGVNYETTGYRQTSYTVGVTVHRIMNDFGILSEDCRESREANYMGEKYFSAGVMYRNKTSDVNLAMANARKVLEKLRGKVDEADVVALAKRWICNEIVDWYSSEPRGNRNTAHCGTQPCTVLIDMSHRQSVNLVDAYENCVESEGQYSESDVATERLAKAWAKAERIHGKELDDALCAGGWDRKWRVAVLCKSDFAKNLLHDAGIEDSLVPTLSDLIKTVSRFIDETAGMKLPRYLGLRMLKVVPPINANRDVNGRPKQTTFGGTARMVWSSAAENAACRTASFAREDEPYAVRTTAIVDEILQVLEAAGKTDESREIVGGFVNFAWGPVRALTESFAERNNWRTKGGYFPGTDELKRAADLLRANWDVLMPISTATVGAVKDAIKEYEAATA